VEFPHLERLSRAECRQLLPAAPVGRLAMPTSHFPTLEPVSFALIEGEVVVAARAGSAGDAVAAGTVVAFEADVLDHARRQGWSVVVTGRVEDLDPDVVPLVIPHLGPWPVAASDRLLLVRSDRVAGQRIVTGPAAAPGGRDEGAAAPAEAPDSPGPRPVLTRRTIHPDEALARLAHGGQEVGRLVITLAGEPAVFPLNFTVDAEAIVFRTASGTKLSGIARSMATFEVDAIDASGQGWTVAFEGLAQDVLDTDPPALQARVAGLPLVAWPGGNRPHVVRITPYRVHGTAWTAQVPGSADTIAGSAPVHQA
jgi:nitroimidazol reductase NimA-like FMN-containing flavoprotein (pyridoxamine 5'-phosphate oxidase superfamily)